MPVHGYSGGSPLCHEGAQQGRSGNRRFLVNRRCRESFYAQFACGGPIGGSAVQRPQTRPPALPALYTPPRAFSSSFAFNAKRMLRPRHTHFASRCRGSARHLSRCRPPSRRERRMFSAAPPATSAHARCHHAGMSRVKAGGGGEIEKDSCEARGGEGSGAVACAVGRCAGGR